MFNGPLLALFCTALLLRDVPQRFALVGFVLGLLVNLALALGAPQISWLWWNVAGFFVALIYTLAALLLKQQKVGIVRYQYPKMTGTIRALLMMTAAILLLCFMLHATGN